MLWSGNTEKCIVLLVIENNTGLVCKKKNWSFQSSLREVSQLKQAYAPQPSFDDMAWFGLAYARIHELFRLDGFLRVAEDIFKWCWNNGWDTTGK